jgi:hypothetical protein
MNSINLAAAKEYQGTIPDGAVRMILSMGTQGKGEVTVGNGDPQPLYYGKNEYVVSEGAKSYTMQSEEPLEVVEDFVFMPSTIDAYMEQKFNELMGPVNTTLENHDARIAELEGKAPATSR